MFGWEYPPLHTGGLGVACRGIVRGLRHHGVKVTLVLPHSTTEEGIDVRAPEENEYGTITVPTNLRPYDTSETYTKRFCTFPKEVDELYGTDLGGAVEYFTSKSVDLTRDTYPSIVHCHDWMTYEAGIRAATHHRTPLVAHIHATELDRTDFHPNMWIYERERRGFEVANHIIAVSNYTKNILVQHYGIPPAKITVIHNAHLETPYNPPLLFSQYRKGDPPLVLFLGRLTTQKNPWQFLEVARKVHALQRNVQFVIAGDGPEFPHLLDETCRSGLSDCVIFTGKVSQGEVQSLFQKASCFIMPSLSEPFGLVALEAVAHGVPVILSKQSGVSEVIRHAFIVDFWDTEKFADCILTILRDPPLAVQLRSEAPRILQSLTWQQQTGFIRSLYENLLRS